MKAISRATGESLTYVVTEALRECLKHLQVQKEKTSVEELLGIARRASVANFVELSMVIEGQIGADAGRQCDMFLRRAGVVIEPVIVEQGQLARQAFLDFGKGRHPAG